MDHRVQIIQKNIQAASRRSQPMLLDRVQYYLQLTLIGGAIRLIAAFLLTRVISNLLYGVSASDPLTFIAVYSVQIRFDLDRLRNLPIWLKRVDERARSIVALRFAIFR